MLEKKNTHVHTPTSFQMIMGVRMCKAFNNLAQATMHQVPLYSFFLFDAQKSYSPISSPCGGHLYGFQLSNNLLNNSVVCPNTIEPSTTHYRYNLS